MAASPREVEAGAPAGTTAEPARPDPADRAGVILEDPRAQKAAARWAPGHVAFAAGAIFVLSSLALLLFGPMGGHSTWARFWVALTTEAGVWCVVMLGARRLIRRGWPARPVWPIAFAVLVTSMLLGMGAVQDRPFLLAMMSVMPAMMPALGSVMLGLGVPRWKGQSLGCAKCGYEYVRGKSEAERCSECGAFWTERGGLRRGVKTGVRWPWIALGLFILAASIASPLLARSWKPFLPTSLLIARVGDPGGNFTIDEMQAINARRLSPAEQAQLTSALLDKRVRRDYLSPDEQRWLDGRIAAGALSPDLLERFYLEMVEVWVVAPERARAGAPFTVGVGLQDHRPLTTSCTPLLLVGGYWLDDSTDRTGESDVAQRTEDIGAEHRSFRRLTRAKYPHEATLIATEAGARTIHLEYWLLVMPRSSGAVSMTWGPDGKPAPPRGALFLERREVSKTIQVAP